MVSVMNKKFLKLTPEQRRKLRKWLHGQGAALKAARRHALNKHMGCEPHMLVRELIREALRCIRGTEKA